MQKEYGSGDYEWRWRQGCTDSSSSCACFSAVIGFLQRWLWMAASSLRSHKPGTFKWNKTLLCNSYTEEGRRCPHPGYLVVPSSCRAGALLRVLCPTAARSPAGSGSSAFPRYRHYYNAGSACNYGSCKSAGDLSSCPVLVDWMSATYLTLITLTSRRVGRRSLRRETSPCE